ncbi:MAG: DUF362 domain-containing protein [Desulfobacteraceae bacterium]|nr:DUF362 domain-containing protein [Desulfobacteraceae bacterium]
MNPIQVSIQKFTKNQGTVKKAVQDSNAFENLSSNAKVIVKPNIVVWINGPYPKWGVITTSVVMEETVRLLAEYGVTDISIAEGSLQSDPNEKNFGQKAFESLGYKKLKDRYGVKLLDVWEQPFEKVDIEDGLSLKVNADLMESDFLVNLPVLKTHAQVKVSLGIKNLKGFLNVSSRKKCHNADLEKDLDYMVSRLPKLLPPSATIIDGIFTIERGPSFDGRPRRSDLIIASSNILAADMTGAKVIGHEPSDIPYLSRVAADQGMKTDFSNIEVKGEKIESVQQFHEHTFPFNADNTLPVSFEKMGIKGLKFHKYDSTLCTYCSGLTGMILSIIAMSYKGKPYNDVEFLTGKRLRPSSGMKKSVLVGQCMCALNKDHDGAQEIVKINGCPPNPNDAALALKGIGIDVDPSAFGNYALAGAYLMEQYKDKPEFDPSFYQID